MMLIDLDTAKRHLRFNDDEVAPDEIIEEKIVQASAVILDYLKLSAEPYEVTEVMKAATCLAVEALFDGGDPLSDVVIRLLHRRRDPALA
jgi:hypothetical protein